VIRKIFEALFRHKFLLLLPPLLIPGIVTPIAFFTTPPTYESAAGIWIDHPAYLDVKDGSSPWVTAVQSQVGRMNDLLKTRTFVNDVASRTSLASLVGNPAGEARIDDLMTRSVTIGGAAGTGATTAAQSDHLLVVRVSTNNAQLSYELTKGIVDAYQEKTAADQADQASVAVDFYQSRLDDAKQNLTRVTSDLRRYNATLTADGTDPASLDAGMQATMLDPKLGTLQAAVQTAQVQVNTAQNALNQAQQDAMAAAQGQQYGFQVLDEPQLATTSTVQTKKIMIYPIAAVVAGLALTAMLLVLLVASDRSARSEQDLAPGLRILGTVPMLELKRVPKELSAVATRRAIGAIAGTALPAARGAR
jgi:uncharacterized protein involved in exopolysaccharide biosynthesis